MAPSQSFTPVILRGNIVRLEPLTEKHIDALSEVAYHPDLWQYTMTHISNRAELETYVHAALAVAAHGTGLPFVTVLQSENRVIGSTRFANYDRESRRVEIGWTWVAPPWQRSGANVEAKLLMMTHAFEELGCHRVEFKTDVLNQKSRTALQGIGAVEEGILRQHAIVWTGRVRDSIYYSVLAPEWPAVKQRLQAKLTVHQTARVDPTSSSTLRV
jgi:RimJ/RimL family protein N-acetyltransferase